MTFTLDPTLASIVRPGVLWFEGATVVERDHRMDAPLAAAEAGVRINPPAETTAVRTMYKRVGIDPTKTRPSSEALLRRGHAIVHRPVHGGRRPAEMPASDWNSTAPGAD